MTPARIAAASWTRPRGGGTLVGVHGFSCTGYGANRKTPARCPAPVWLKLPEIGTPLGKEAALNCGFDCTTPSRTIAPSFCGGVLLIDAAASASNFVWPAELKFTRTSQPELYRASAEVTSLPVSAVG